MIYLGAIFTFEFIRRLLPAIYYTFFGYGFEQAKGLWIIVIITGLLALTCFAVSIYKRWTVPALIKWIGWGMFIYGFYRIYTRALPLIDSPQYMLLVAGYGTAFMVVGLIFVLFNIGRKKAKETDPRVTNRSPRQPNKHGDIFEEGDKHVDIFQ